MSLSDFLHRYWPALLLLLASLAITALSYNDYGVSWDENIQRGIGRISYDYAFGSDTTLLHFEDKEYGVGYELLLTAIERKAHLTDTRSVFMMRHMVNHIFFLLCMFCGYVLVERLFHKKMLSALGFVLLAFHPRIYAHSFFNSKDIPFLGILLVALLIAHVAFLKNRAGWYALLGVACGYATSIRILGILPFTLFCLFLAIDLLAAWAAKKKMAAPAIHLLVFTVASCATLYAAWPLLWTNPIANFCGAVKKLSHFPWEGYVLFNGHMYPGKNLPWFYLPGWFAITTPMVWLLAGLAGIMLIVLAVAKRPAAFLQNTPERNFLLYLLCLCLPVCSVIALHSVVYDDWRHVYFIYPCFVMLSLYAINSIKPIKLRCIAYGACIAQGICTGAFMYRGHPFQQVYFNSLVSHNRESLRQNYDLEYWGCSFKQGLEYILAHDTSGTIKMQQTLLPLNNNLKILTEDQRKRITVVDEQQQPDYLITNFRDHPANYTYPVFYEIRVQNSTIMRVYKLRP